jgi:hypothetical protein
MIANQKQYFPTNEVMEEASIKCHSKIIKYIYHGEIICPTVIAPARSLFIVMYIKECDFLQTSFGYFAGGVNDYFLYLIAAYEL